MPALPSVPNVVRVDYHFTYGEDMHAKCREFFRYPGTPPTVAELSAWTNAIIASWNTHMASHFSVDVNLDEVVATDLSSPTAASSSTGGTNPGTDTHGANPGSTCVLESQHITRRYRGGHPRIYWPAGTQNNLQDPQKWASAFVTAFQTDRAAWIGDIIGMSWSGSGTLEQVNVSYYEGFTTHTGTTGRVRNVPTVRLTPLVDAVAGFVIRQGIAAIRKRLLKLA